MKILVGVQGHAGGHESITVNSESWRNSGCDMVGLEGKDSPVPNWPNWFKWCIQVPVRNGKSLGYGLRPTLQLDCLRELLAMAKKNAYPAILWTECDSIFLAPPIEPPPIGIGAVIAGYCPPEWKCGDGPFLHPPFLMTVVFGKMLVAAAEEFVEKGNGAPDVLVGLTCKEAGIPIIPLPRVYSCNGLDMRVKGKMMEARNAARRGAWHIHGIKRQDHQDFILDKTDQFPADSL